MTSNFKSNDIWNIQTAKSYDTPGIGMFSNEVLETTTRRLDELAEGGRALEFAIGTGRVAVPLSERGVPVVGIELSPAMVDQLRTKVDEEAIPVVIDDMATAKAPGRFSLAYLVFNTISNLLTQSEQVACFRNAARHLEPGGRFVIELWVPELKKLTPGQKSVAEEVESGYIRVDTYDTLNQVLEHNHIRYGEGRDAKIFRSPHRYIWPAELDLMAEVAGFELESREADWDRSPFTAESPSHVSVYRLRDQ